MSSESDLKKNNSSSTTIPVTCKTIKIINRLIGVDGITLGVEVQESECQTTNLFNTYNAHNNHFGRTKAN
ncbi:hypothetical protein I4U23_012174 [Adineta vaga]|nr:hypothetical protein I4U23_012174 [Adineta vaga]